ncbi:MAG TPA: GNAT family N-acetyltransferase [Pyrinomonadaceae bacterium]|jgi:ribosomal protein S18 acetylase RimI-like enzyme
MTPTVLVRPATLSDVEILADLGARTFAETFAAENSAENMDAYLSSAFSAERTAEELADKASVFLIAEMEGEAAGYAKLLAGEPPSCVEGERAIELSRLYVGQKWLGRGIGQALMQKCVDEARRAGARTMWLGVWERNFRAQAFYRKWGFRHVGEQIFMLGSDAQTDWVMQCELV